MGQIDVLAILALLGIPSKVFKQGDHVPIIPQNASKLVFWAQLAPHLILGHGPCYGDFESFWLEGIFWPILVLWSAICSLWAMGRGGYWNPPEPKFSGASGASWTGPIRGVQDHKYSDLLKVEGEVLGGDMDSPP
ncbi:hypothetical protein O181_072651 [Austropuccinia psidii MF-1]|uniref:Uncharacterized protein n=1 Tax=Austropuccinia psidii MF-1 TaxID=1389203 RepID=A0A9Q3F338_9BASI|nr:hypothetical protein [Austropuccinia psidii MF-1]